MAVKNLNTLVLRGVTVVGDVLGGQKGIGCYSATAQMPALRSLWRHASSSWMRSMPLKLVIRTTQRTTRTISTS